MCYAIICSGDPGPHPAGTFTCIATFPGICATKVIPAEKPAGTVTVYTDCPVRVMP